MKPIQSEVIEEKCPACDGRRSACQANSARSQDLSATLCEVRWQGSIDQGRLSDAHQAQMKEAAN
jgi:predicted solute-binding protein